MELIPRNLVVAVFMAPASAAPTSSLSSDQLGRIWLEVAKDYGFTQLAMAGDGSSGNLLGPAAEDGVTIQPPLLQIRDSIRTTTEQSADKAQVISQVVARHLGVSQFFNLGVRLIYHAAVPGNDGSSFVLGRVLSKGEEDLAQLRAGGQLWGGVKYVITNPGVMYTLLIEPLIADPKYLYLDLDAQLPGVVDATAIVPKARECERFITGPVSEYLDSLVVGRGRLQ